MEKEGTSEVLVLLVCSRGDEVRVPRGNAMKSPPRPPPPAPPGPKTSECFPVVTVQLIFTLVQDNNPPHMKIPCVYLPSLFASLASPVPRHRLFVLRALRCRRRSTRGDPSETTRNNTQQIQAQAQTEIIFSMWATNHCVLAQQIKHSTHLFVLFRETTRMDLT